MSEPKAWFKIGWFGWLILFAIIGVIVAVAIPSYVGYVHHAQASEAISLMGGAKTPLAEYFEDKKKWPSKLSEVAGSTSGNYTLSVAITKGADGTGDIELTGTMRTEGVDRRVAGTTILMMSSDGGKNWICKPGTMEPKNLPALCRN